MMTTAELSKEEMVAEAMNALLKDGTMVVVTVEETTDAATADREETGMIVVTRTGEMEEAMTMGEMEEEMVVAMAIISN
jgi:hypothetical protein